MMQTSHTRQFVVKAFILVWAILCILLFMLSSGKVTYVQWANLAEWQHLPGKLDRLDPAHDMANLLLAIAGVGIFSGACMSLGSFVAKKAKIDHTSSSETALTRLAFLSTEFLIGHGLFSIIFLTLGALYQLTPVYVIIILVAGSSLGFRHFWTNFIKAFAEVKGKLKEMPMRKRDRAIFFLVASILLFSLLYSTARISYDSSAVYFSDAKLSALAQHVQFFTEDSFVASLFQSAIQFAVLIQLFGDQSARLLSWVFGVVVLVISLAVGEKVGSSKPARLILATLLLTSTAFLDLLGDGKVDIMSTAPAIAAIYWMLVESQDKALNIPLLLLSGLLTGLAIVARPFNAFLLGVFILLFYLQRTFRKGGFERLSYKHLAHSLFWMGIGVLGFGVYHSLANWMILGDPLAFLSNASKVNPSSGPWDYNSDQILITRLLYPFVATFYNSRYTLGNISPMFLAFLPSLFLPEIRKNIKLPQQMRGLLLISIVTLLLWIFLFFTVYEIRYVLFLWVILFIPVAEIIATLLNSNDPLFQRMVTGLIITLLAFNVVRTLYISIDKYAPVDKQGNPQCFCDSLNTINAMATPGDRVLTLSGFRYYLRSDLFACSTKHDEYRKLKTAAKESNESFWREIYREGYKYVVYENDYATRHLQMGDALNPDDTPNWLELSAIFGRPGDTLVLYRIRIISPQSDTTASCRMDTNGIWEVQSTKQEN